MAFIFLKNFIRYIDALKKFFLNKKLKKTLKFFYFFGLK